MYQVVVVHNQLEPSDLRHQTEHVYETLVCRPPCARAAVANLLSRALAQRAQASDTGTSPSFSNRPCVCVQHWAAPSTVL